MLKIQSLASGSKGNSTYVGSSEVSLLVDLGLGIRDIMARLKAARVAPESIQGIIVTHEHSDHVSGISAFLKRFSACKLYVHKDAKECFVRRIGFVPDDRITVFSQPFSIGEIMVDFFSLPHDSEFCFGFTFTHGPAKVAIATDLGYASNDVLKKMAGAQVVVIEANHDIVKLGHNLKYPKWLKDRIAGNRGHLSNNACGEAVYKLASLGVLQVVLAHLSEENNSPTLAFSVVSKFLASKGIFEGTDISIDVASQHEVGMAYEIGLD